MRSDAERKLDLLGRHILSAARNELYLAMRFLDIALNSLTYEMSFSTTSIGTDGNKIYFNPKYLAKRYQIGRHSVSRIYLHMLIHSIFCHMLPREGKEERLWNLATDIAVESIIDTMDRPEFLLSTAEKRFQFYAALKNNISVLSAEKIYHYLEQKELSQEEFNRLEREFWMDDHCFWLYDSQKNSPQSAPQNSDGDNPDGDPKQPPEQDENNIGTSRLSMTEEERKKLEKKWKDISKKTQTNLETISKDIGRGTGTFAETLKVANRQKYDYKKFLRKFSVTKEEIKIDPDSYDYVFYTYGLRMYGNMPLIESLEYKDVKRVEEFVIAIDTSGSCSGELVKRFLEETWSVLKSQEGFFRRFHIRILQCDAKIQSEEVVTNEKELEFLMKNFQIKGGGGTDFRPVFDYVDRLVEERVFAHLRGLIYFTDGIGEYPLKKPWYETAFVFLREDYMDVSVPSWAIKLILEPDDLITEN